MATGDRARSMTGRAPRQRPVVETPGSFQQHVRSVAENGCQVKENSGLGATPGGKYQSGAGAAGSANNARILRRSSGTSNGLPIRVKGSGPSELPSNPVTEPETRRIAACGDRKSTRL